MKDGGVSTIWIDYGGSVPVIYDDGVSTVRIDDNSMLSIRGYTHHTQKTKKYASHNKRIIHYSATGRIDHPLAR